MRFLRNLQLVATLAGLMLGCTSSATTTPTTTVRLQESALRNIDVDRATIHFSRSPTAEYGGTIEHELGPAESRLLEILLGAGGLRADAALSRAARELARTTPDPSHVPGSLVSGVIAWAGLTDPRPRLSVLEFDDAEAQCQRTGSGSVCESALMAIAEAAAAAFPPLELRLGVGMWPTGAGQTRVIIIVSEQLANIAPFPRAVPSGGGFTLSGRLLGPRRHPSLEVVDATGGAQELEVRSGEDNRFQADVRCAHGDGLYQVELLADGVHGPEVVANVVIACGVDAPRSITLEIERLREGISLQEIAQANFMALNEERERHGLPPLRWSDEAATVAREHSQDMANAGFVGHRSPTTGDAGDRFDRAGIENAVVRENIARGYGPRGIHEGLMSSPGHRGNILAEDVTFVGIGVAWDADEGEDSSGRDAILLTQNFYSLRGADIPDAPGEELRRRVTAARTEADLREIRWHDGLNVAAQAFAEAVARDRQADGRRSYDRALQGTPFQRVGTRMIITGSFAQLLELDFWQSSIAQELGVGVARMREGDQRGGVVMIVSSGER